MGPEEKRSLFDNILPVSFFLFIFLFLSYFALINISISPNQYRYIENHPQEIISLIIIIFVILFNSAYFGGKYVKNKRKEWLENVKLLQQQRLNESELAREKEEALEIQKKNERHRKEIEEMKALKSALILKLKELKSEIDLSKKIYLNNASEKERLRLIIKILNLKHKSQELIRQVETVCEERFDIQLAEMIQYLKLEDQKDKATS